MKPLSALLVGSLLSVALPVATAARPVAPSDAAALFQDASNGAVVYQANCAACHQADGTGLPGTFPPLAGNPNAADAAYVESVIRDGLSGPVEVLGTSYDQMMPPIPLADGEIADVVAYVQTLARPTPPRAQPVPAGEAAGDAGRGKALFAGATRLSAGGPTCFACHRAGALDNGGAGLGPDLTTAVARLGGEAGLASWLSAPPTQTMQSLFSDKPLTPSEISDLTAFLATAEDARGAGPAGFLIGGLAGMAVLLGAVFVAGRGGRPTYVDKIRSGQ